VQAASAFPPLQSAAAGLLQVIQMVEVRRSFIQSYSVSIGVDLSEQKSAANADDVAALTTHFSNLAAMLRGPLQSVDACPPTLPQRIENMSRLFLFSYPAMCR
jgi:hypothetical protein